MRAVLSTIVFIAGCLCSQDLVPHAGGEYRFNPKNIPCLDEAARNDIIKRTTGALPHSSLLNTVSSSAPTQFSWPLKLKDGIGDPGFYGISNFVDHDPSFPNQLKDYVNGIRTYDVASGYNHKGTDIFLWPFSWLKMDNDEVEVIAVADGIITGKADGNFDRSCAMSNSQWNALYVRNLDSSVVWYGHLKKNSVTSMNTGDTIKTGEYVGIVGSSGSSTGPHLHMEVYDKMNKLVDPWFGPGNPTIDTSWWIQQRPYYHSRINKIATHIAWPVFPACPGQETPYYRSEFLPGSAIYFITYYQDQLKGQVSTYTIMTPDNIVWNQWTHSLTNADHYAASWWGWYWTFPPNAALGDWTFSVGYEGSFYSTTFTITNSPTEVVRGDHAVRPEYYLYNAYPNPFNPMTTIRYSIPKREYVHLTLHDLLGRELGSIVHELKEQGVYEASFDASSFSSGTYLCRLQAGNFVQTKRMTVVK